MVFSKKNSKKKIIKVLSNILGIGKCRSEYICQKFGYQKKATLIDLDSLELEKLKYYVEQNFITSKLLKKKVSKDIKFLIELGNYKGKRHQLGYPVRGQRTLSNGKSQKRLARQRFFEKNSLYPRYPVKPRKHFGNIKKKKNLYLLKGKVAEWFKAAVLKFVVSF